MLKVAPPELSELDTATGPATPLRKEIVIALFDAVAVQLGSLAAIWLAMLAAICADERAP